MYHISEPKIRRFFFQNLCHFVHFRAAFIDSFSFAMKRCNTSQGFGAFFVQSCDRFLFTFYSFSHFFPFFLAGYQMIITNSALRAPRWLYIIRYPARPRRIIVNYGGRQRN